MTFTPGQSGNPAGRRRGSKNRVNLLLDKMASADAIAVLQAVLDKAKAGDIPAAQTILSRIWPPMKGRTISLALPPIQTVADVVTALGCITDAVGRGEVTPAEAQHLGSVLELARRGIEMIEFERRISAVEARHAP